jgi:hypothetical protein
MREGDAFKGIEPCLRWATIGDAGWGPQGDPWWSSTSRSRTFTNIVGDVERGLQGDTWWSSTMHIRTFTNTTTIDTSVSHFAGRSVITKWQSSRLTRGLVGIHLSGGLWEDQEVTLKVTSHRRSLGQSYSSGGHASSPDWSGVEILVNIKGP